MIDEVLNPVVVAIKASIVIVGLLDGLLAVGDGLLVTSFFGETARARHRHAPTHGC